MKSIVKLGEIVYARPGDYFWFAPPKPGQTYRFQVGPAHGALSISAWDTDCGSEPISENYDGDDFLDHKCVGHRRASSPSMAAAPHTSLW